GDNDSDRLLLPLVFCRVCGQEYYQVTRVKSDSKHLEPLTPTELDEQGQQYVDDGYLLVEDEQNPIWTPNRIEELPENWFRDPEQRTKIKKEYLDYVPQQIFVTPDGIYSEEPRENAAVGWFLKAPLLTCLSCGEVYDKRRSEYSKLSRLSSEGRSTATTLLSISTVTQLRHEKSLEPEAQKILSFTDNRQDASLQSGHFNDFVQVGLLRSAIYRALKQNEYLDHSNVASEVVKTLNLSADEYAQNPGEIGAQPRRNREALTAYIEYLIYQDLRRGWRIIQPNLEQCGLLEIRYGGLEEVCNSDDHWQNNSLLSQATPENRFKVAKAFLDHLRRALALDAHCLDPVNHEGLKRKVNNTLKEPWNFDAEERLEEWKWFRLGQRFEGQFSLSPISVVGKYLRSRRAWPFLSVSLNTDDYKLMLLTLVKLLFDAGYLNLDIDENDFRLQLRIDTLLWVKGDGLLQVYDPVRSVRMTTDSEASIRHQANRFFTQFYKDEVVGLHRLEGREHTGQTNPELREDREIRFRSGNLSCLFCSPTMELGIDIADLVTVNMRNVPPSPANYAQRSGRAGRAGQPALITTYCSTGSGHDQYFFNRKEEIVAGVVVPPRIDLSNQELVESHIHAVWLAHVEISLKDSIADILDLNQKELPLLDHIKQQIHLSENKINECLKACQSIVNQCKEDLEKTAWYSDAWLESVVRSAPANFNEAFNRWRELYNTAHQQLIDSQEKLRHAHQLKLSRAEKNEAERLEREARHQKDLLCNQVKNRDDSDFYPYRYLATEGFLPGYNFPRLPVRAYIQQGKDKGEFISRGRFLAISEFGPRNILYHEGSKYTVYRSLFPLGDPDSRFTQVKICKQCGTFHTGEHLKMDICEHCHSTLDANNSDYISNLFEMTTVATQRRDRITCNEEDRIRKGYEIGTHFRFSIQDGKESKYVAEALDTDGNALLELTYGPSAAIWRINKKWRRSREEGYTLELTLGIWGKKKQDYEDTALDAGEANLRHRVQLFVRDARNVLLVKPTSVNPLQEAELSNLQYALHKAICAIFQVDESEIASERIGRDEHRAILFWEAAEGGVGILQRLVEEPDALRSSASKALEVCHFDPETGEHLNDGEDCARACYHCLLTYYNQRDHNILNRNLIKEILLKLSQCETKRGYETRTYDQHYQWLRNQVDSRSDLEKKFLDQLYRNGRRLPDEAQKLLSDLPSRPDFYYKDGYVCVFCDGSVHDTPEQRKEDQQIRSQLRKSGFRVVIIRYDRPLDEQIAENEDIFGVVNK
ncbi:MAG: helicase-related protein, partial [bacterium]